MCLSRQLPYVHRDLHPSLSSFPGLLALGPTRHPFGKLQTAFDRDTIFLCSILGSSDHVWHLIIRDFSGWDDRFTLLDSADLRKHRWREGSPTLVTMRSTLFME